MLRGDVDQRFSSRQRKVGASGILVRGQHVDELRLARRAEFGQLGGQQIHAHAVCVHRQPHHVDAERPIRGDGAAVGDLLADDCIARLRQRFGGKRYRLHRTVGEGQAVGVHGNAFPLALALGHDRPQAGMAQLARVLGERLVFVGDGGVGGALQSRHRHGFRVGAPDREVVLRRSHVRRCRPRGRGW